MEIKLLDLEFTLKKIKRNGKVNINTVPLFDEYYKSKGEQDEPLVDIYNNIKINDETTKIETEQNNDFLSFSTPPELFIKNDLLNNSEVVLKEKKTEDLMCMLAGRNSTHRSNFARFIKFYTDLSNF